MNRSAGTTSPGSQTSGTQTPGSHPPGSQTPPHSGPADGRGSLPADVFCADPEGCLPVSEAALPEGFGGQLSLKDPQLLNLEDAGRVLQRLEALVCWATAQQVRVIARIQDVLEADFPDASGRRDTSISLSLAAAEVGTLLNVPHMTAMSRVFEAGELCREYPQTLSHLGTGRITYRHAQEILDHTRSLEEKDRGEFESDLLSLAVDSTVAKFRTKARRLRECRHPETIPERHRDAFGRRRVSLEALPDGMSCISAFLAAEKGQAIFTSLSGAARGAKKTGDGRSMDQLRADIFASVFLDGPADASGVPDRTGTAMEPGATSVPGAGAPDTQHSNRPDAGASPARSRPRSGRSSRRNRRQKLKTEIMVLIQADTLTGFNEAPAELNGYGPLSPETGRRMFREAANWTPLIQDPVTGEILHVGRRRRVPAGLKRWLQARDGTCRFPGCSVSVLNSEIDHTRPWAWGGATAHSNLEHLCPKHHRLKTLGHWKAVQPEPGVIKWTSPGGLERRTGPMLDYGGETPGASSPGLPAPDWTAADWTADRGGSRGESFGPKPGTGGAPPDPRGQGTSAVPGDAPPFRAARGESFAPAGWGTQGVPPAPSGQGTTEVSPDPPPF